MRKCPNCGGVPTEVSDITGLAKHMLLYWCADCGMLAHGHSSRERLFNIPGRKLANGVIVSLSETMSTDTIKLVGANDKEAVSITRKVLPPLTLPAPTTDPAQIKITNNADGENPPAIAVKIFGFPVHETKKPLAPPDATMVFGPPTLNHREQHNEPT